MSLRPRIGELVRWTGIVAIVCLVAASAARADGEWKISEHTMTELEAPEASIFGTASESFKLSVAWYASEIECGTLATEAPTKIFKEGASEAVMKLSSCQVLGPPFVSETCKPIEPITLRTKGKLLLHGGKTYELFEPQAGKTSLGLIEFKAGTECPLPSSNELKGAFVGEVEAGERIEQPLTFNSSIESLFAGDSLSFNTHPATLKGKSVWALAAGYKGLKWAAEGKETKKEEEEKLQEETELMEKELECKRGSTEVGWYVCGNLLEESEKVTGSGTSFVLSIPSLGGVELFKCKSTSLGGTLEKGGVLSGTLTISSCEKGKGNCVPETPVVFSVKGRLVSAESKTFVLFSGEPFGTVQYNELCSLAETIVYQGSFMAECEKCGTELKAQPLNFVTSESFPEDRIKYGSYSTTIEGNLALELSGEHKGMAWGGQAK